MNHGRGRPEHFLTLYPSWGEVRIARYLDGKQVDAVHNLAAAGVRERRRELRAYLRRIGVPGRLIREVCGWLHRSGRCFVTPCPGGAWRAAMAEVLA